MSRNVAPPSDSGRSGEHREHGLPSDGASAGGRRAPARAGTREGGRARRSLGDERQRDVPRDGDAVARGAPRRRPTDTHVSQEQRDAAGGGRLVRSGGRAPSPVVTSNEARRAGGRAGPPIYWDGRLFCGHDARIPHRSTCAACFLWHEFQITRLPCGHQPNDTRPATCDVCRFYLEDLDERSGRPRRLECGQPAAALIPWGACGCCRRAGRTHGSLDLLFCGHTMERPGRNYPSCRARKDLLDAEGRTHMLHTRHFHGGPTAGNRSWSPPNGYDLLSGSFGTMDDSLRRSCVRTGWTRSRG